MANLRGVVHADDDALEHALHARCSHELDKNPGRCGLRATQGPHGLDHIQQPQGHRGRQRHSLRLKADEYAIRRDDGEGQAG